MIIEGTLFVLNNRDSVQVLRLTQHYIDRKIFFHVLYFIALHIHSIRMEQVNEHRVGVCWNQFILGNPNCWSAD